MSGQPVKPSTERIRIELSFGGALTVRELADRMGLADRKERERVAPLVWQMTYRTQEIQRIPGNPSRYALRGKRTALQETWR